MELSQEIHKLFLCGFHMHGQSIPGSEPIPPTFATRKCLSRVQALMDGLGLYDSTYDCHM